MPDHLLIFGGNSYIAKAFNKNYGEQYNITNVYKNSVDDEFNFDFEKDDVKSIADKLKGKYKAVLFFQGRSPAVNARDITRDYFIQSLTINLITPGLLIKELEGKLVPGGLVLFISSVAKKKGSYDPAYAAAKAGLMGLMYSLANAYPNVRFNVISLGLVENSPVFNNMTADFRKKHSDRMFGNSFVKVNDVITVVNELITNQGINRADFEIDGGYS